MKFRYLNIILILYFTGCSFFVSTSSKRRVSIFDEKTYYNIDPNQFEDYKWDEQAINENKMYLNGLVTYFFKKEYRKALETFEECIKMYPNDVRPYIRMIECYTRLGENQLAMNMLNNSILVFEDLALDPQIKSYRDELSSGKTIHQFREKKSRLKNILLFIPNLFIKLIKLLPFV